MQDAFNSVTVSPTVSLMQGPKPLDWLRFFLDADCEVVATLMGLAYMSIRDFEEIVDMLIHHKNSTIDIQDIRSQTTFLSFGGPSRSENLEECRTRLAAWQRVVDRFGFDYSGAQASQYYLFKQCCPKGCELLKIHAMFDLKRNNKPFGKRQVLEIHTMSGTNKYARRRVFHEFVLRNGANPCIVDERKRTPTIRAIEKGTLGRWLEALNNAGINIEAVALHTLRSVTPASTMSLKNMLERNGNGLYPRSQGRFTLLVQQMYEHLGNVATFRE